MWHAIWTKDSSLIYNSEVSASDRKHKLNEGKLQRKGGLIYLRLEYSLQILNMFKICLLSLRSSLNTWKDIWEPLGSAQTQKKQKIE